MLPRTLQTSESERAPVAPCGAAPSASTAALPDPRSVPPRRGRAVPSQQTGGVSPDVRVLIEIGKRRVFAVALDWPGWARRARTADDALTSLGAYGPRYGAVLGEMFQPGALTVVGEVDGGSNPDFGVLAGPGAVDEGPLSPAEIARSSEILRRSWSAFDLATTGPPVALRVGPRGGGRDRDAIRAHVADAERAYAAKVGVRPPAAMPWPQRRELLVAALGNAAPVGAWPARYLARRVAWHVLDHLWEIEDRSER